jgi:hypothetical protein
VQRDGGRLLRATLKVLEGAFRFTTSLASRSRYRHEIEVQFTTFTAGVRGTDIWGRNFGDREVVVLIEGRISVRRGAHRPVEMKEALTYYQAPMEGTPSEQPIPAELLGEWAQQTELQKGRGAQSLDGNSTSPASTTRTPRWRSTTACGATVIRRASCHAPTPGGQHYYVRLAGFASRAEAEALAQRLREAYPGISPAASR